MLEQLYPLKLIEKNSFYAFILGFAYSIIGIGLAVLLFPEDPALVAVAFIAIMAYPMINGLMKQEEKIESKREEFNVLIFLKDHKYVFLLYLLFFIGVLFAFSFFALMLPELATNHIFQNQLDVHYSGRATFSLPLFWDILSNNLIVLVVIFLTAFFIGDGGIFLIIWNASVWGTIFGHLAKTAALNANQNPLYYFFIVIATIFTHMILEAFAYIAAATTGGVISKALVGERFLSRRFKYVLVNTVISLVFTLIILLIAVAIETYVLGNATAYREIIRHSLG